MPAESEKQRRLFAVALSDPAALRPENRDLAKLPKRTLHDFAATKGLGALKKKKRSQA